MSGTDVVRPSRPAQRRRRHAGLRAEPAPRHRGRAGLRRRRRRPRSARRSASTRRATTSSAWCCSTTGAPATSRRGSTCRSARSSASRSPPASPPWVAPMAALTEARVGLPGQDPEPLPYLRGAGGRRGLDIHSRCGSTARVVARPRYADMYWSPAQMLAHLTVNGASPAQRRPLRLGHHQRHRSRDQRGSLLELTWNGEEPLTCDGPTRTFLRGRRHGDDDRLGAGPGRRPGRPGRGDRDRGARPRLNQRLGTPGSGWWCAGARTPRRRRPARRASGRARG